MSTQPRLEQKALFKGWQTFELRDDTTLHVVVKKGLSKNEYDLPVEALDPDPARHSRIPGGWIAAIIVLGLLTILWWWLCVANWQIRSEAVPFAVTGLIFTVLFGLSCYGLKVNIIKSVVFYNRYSGHVALVLWDKRPTPEQCDGFVARLAEKARIAAKSVAQSKSRSLAEEIRQLKNLLDDGALSREEFDTSKRKLLKQLDEKERIGFESD